jgi:lipid-A-disaccharide synthase
LTDSSITIALADMPVRVFITVAEVSGDQHASALVRNLRQLAPDAIVEGIGGDLMRREGATIHHQTTTRAAMGYHAVARVLEVWQLLRWTEVHFRKHRPDVLVCVDSPAMNFHFAKLAHRLGIPVLYYVAPQLWAWREGRIRKVRKWVDQLACILPFEEEYFRSRGVNATFVGHPLFDELPPGRAPQPGPRFPERPPVIGLLPGSRAGEANANFPYLLQAAIRIRREFRDASFLVPTTSATHPIVTDLSTGWVGIDCARNQFDHMVPRCDLCLCVSGTATLHVACWGVPMIAVYRMNPLVVRAGAWLMKTDTFALVNLLADNRRHIVPEFIPWVGSADPVADAAIDMLKHPRKLQEQRDNLAQLVARLDHPGASTKVAHMTLDLARKSVAGAVAR